MHKLRVKFAEVQAPVIVQKMNNAIHRINIYPLDKAIDFLNTYLLDSDISVDSAIQCLNNPGKMFKGIATSTLTPTLPVFTELLLKCILNFEPEDRF